jgi:hypothetical protein
MPRASILPERLFGQSFPSSADIRTRRRSRPTQSTIGRAGRTWETAAARPTRTWANVTGLVNGFGGTELLRATAVNTDGTVTGDTHSSSTGDGYTSLSFTPVQATGVRIAFANPDPATTCSGVQGTCNHYRVGELEVYAIPR